MAGKSEKRERRRQERVQAEQQAAARERRQRAIGAITAGVLLAATVGAVIVAASSGGGESSATAGGDFGTHWGGLEDRRVAAGVPTMSDSSAGGAHIHPQLTVYADGEEVPIPVNIGIDPANPPEMMAGLHTHDSSGVIHVENAAEPTLGQFFEIWGVPFSRDQLGPYKSTGSDTVRMWVDGEPSREFDDLVLEDGQEVVVAYGSPREMPPGIEQ
jgi:hypothetical protein